MLDRSLGGYAKSSPLSISAINALAFELGRNTPTEYAASFKYKLQSARLRGVKALLATSATVSSGLAFERSCDLVFTRSDSFEQ
jgi:hypothetical protein